MGKDANAPRAVDIGENTVLRLSEPWFGSGRCITMDNFFTSFSLAKSLMDRRLGILGTVRSNKKSFPRSVVWKKGDRATPHGRTDFGFSKNLMYLACKPKKKDVYLLSSYTHSADNDPVSGKPQIAVAGIVCAYANRAVLCTLLTQKNLLSSSNPTLDNIGRFEGDGT